VKANARELGIDPKVLQKTDVHIHVPEGSVPKDGPSAGVTITTAIVSAFTKRPVKRTVAMTGEVTLRGRVLRIGGLKEKSIAARRAGSTTILIPKDNERDLEKIPESVKKDITYIPVQNVREVLAQALV
jgi:ATP-dependent Lon protease